MTDSEPTMSAPSEMDEGAPEVGESSTSSKAPIPIPPPQPSGSPSPPYEVGVMRRSSGHRGVHPYHDAVFQSVPRRVAGQPFQQWLALTRTARQFPAGNPSDVDVSLPDAVEFDVGPVGVEHRSGPGIVGVDVPVITMSDSSPLIDSHAIESSGGADGQSGTRSSPSRQVSCGGHASMEPSVVQRGQSLTHSSPSFSPDQLPHRSNWLAERS